MESEGESKEMIWYGNAGHLCVSNDCRFHLCTEVGDYVISTVGEYYPRSSGETREDVMKTIGVGSKDFYETMVFKIGGRCACGCGLPETGEEVEMDRYGTPKEANEGHMKYCKKYLKKSEKCKTDNSKFVAKMLGEDVSKDE